MNIHLFDLEQDGLDEFLRGFVEHYDAHWSSTSRAQISEHRATENRNRVVRYLHQSERELTRIGFDTSNLEALLLVGSGGANGHAYVSEGQCAAWFALECFDNDDTARVFVMHELIHALHYDASPSFWFQSHEEKQLIWRQLITEGIATYATASILDITDEESLWGGEMAQVELDRWMASCRARETELCQFVRERFNSADPGLNLFYAFDPNDPYGYRQGYYVGLRIIQAITKQFGYSLPQLLAIPVIQLRETVFEFLKRNGALHGPVSAT